MEASYRLFEKKNHVKHALTGPLSQETSQIGLKHKAQQHILLSDQNQF